MKVLHKLVSSIADDAAQKAAGAVVPSNWNDIHRLETFSRRHTLENDALYNSSGPGETFVNTVTDCWLWRGGIFGGVPRLLGGSLGGPTTTGIVMVDPILGVVVSTTTTGALSTSGPSGTSATTEIRGVCVDPPDVWFADRVAGKIYRFDPTAGGGVGAIIGTVTGMQANNTTTSDGPFGICEGNDGNIYVTEAVASGASRVVKLAKANIPTNGSSVTKAVALATAPNTAQINSVDLHIPALASNGKIYVPGINVATVFILDTAAMTWTTIPCASAGAWVVYCDQQYAYIAENGNSTLRRHPIGTTGGSDRVIKMPLGFIPASFTSAGVDDIIRDGDKLYVGMSTHVNPDGTFGAVGIIDLVKFKYVGTIYAGDHTSSVAKILGDLWIGNLGSNQLQRVRLSEYN